MKMIKLYLWTYNIRCAVQNVHCRLQRDSLVIVYETVGVNLRHYVWISADILKREVIIL